MERCEGQPPAIAENHRPHWTLRQLLSEGFHHPLQKHLNWVHSLCWCGSGTQYPARDSESTAACHLALVTREGSTVICKLTGLPPYFLAHLPAWEIAALNFTVSAASATSWNQCELSRGSSGREALRQEHESPEPQLFVTSCCGLNTQCPL